MNSASRSVDVESSQHSVLPCLRALGVVFLAAALLTSGGCQSTGAKTGRLYGVSREFDGHVGRHMPIVLGMKNPRVVVTLCQNTADRSGRYNIHVVIMSSKSMYELGRLDLIADGVRISLARAGAIEAGPDERAANYPINLHDLKTLAGARYVKIRINTAGTQLERTLGPTHIAALDDFYVQCVQESSAPRHAALDNDD